MVHRQSAQEKRRLIIDAAARVMSQKGFAGTTISQVAAEAGVGRGLLHYYFKNKEEILAQLIKENIQLGMSLVRSGFESCQPGQDLAQRLTQYFRAFMSMHPSFFPLFFESWAAARQSAVISREIASYYGEFRSVIRRGLNDVAKRNIIAPSISLKGLSAVLVSLFDSLGIQVMNDPKLLEDDETWQGVEEALRAMLG